MAEPVSRKEPSVRLIQLLFLIVSLMFMVNTVKAFTFPNNLDMLKEKFDALIDQAIGYQKQRQNRLASISRLLKEAKSITNKKQLETFMGNLKEAVDQANEQKMKDKVRIAAGVQQLNMKMQELGPKVQQLKKEGDDPMVRASEQALKTTGTYMNLKKKVLAGEDKDMGENLKEVLNVLKLSKEERHDEL
ncbi:uncharacterized protein V3H82_013956 [Fundulus diaphanus]